MSDVVLRHYMPAAIQLTEAFGREARRRGNSPVTICEVRFREQRVEAFKAFFPDAPADVIQMLEKMAANLRTKFEKQQDLTD